MKTIIFSALLLSTSVVMAEKAPPIKASYTPQEVRQNVWVIHGPLAMPNPQNQGFMNNPAFIITEQGVVVVDPGSSVQTGEMLLSHIRKATDKPVVAMFNTHVHGDHWLGNQAIVDAYPDVKIYAHPKMIEKAKNGEGANWISLMHDMTQGATDGTVYHVPENSIDNGDTIKVAGLEVHVLHNAKAHTETDIMLHIPALDTVFLGDTAGFGRILRLNDGNFAGNIEALDMAIAIKAKTYVPGHGQTGSVESAMEYRDFLSTLYEGVKPFVEEGVADYEIKPQLEPKLDRWKNYSGFDEYVGNFISLAYLEIEGAQF